MEIIEHFNIKPLNTFGIKVDAEFFTEVASLPEVHEAIEYSKRLKLPVLILGGGSNLLFTRDYNGFVIKINLKGISLLREDNKHVYIKASAGENWDEFVNYCCDAAYYGLENLSLIPGNVGASPIQNIGAYGVELKDQTVDNLMTGVEDILIGNIDRTAHDLMNVMLYRKVRHLLNGNC